ncbi:hypothetical protein KSF78_0005876 [Schistosoma japonicum]|nr:hypothetical protein KSF78_0005876 [Schistosoma japonicum]
MLDQNTECIPMSNSKYTNEMKETEEDKTVTSNNVHSLHEQFLIIGPKLQKDDFQFLFNEFNDSTVHDKEKWTPNLHKIKLLKNVAHNFLDKSVQDLNSVKYSHAIQTEDN